MKFNVCRTSDYTGHKRPCEKAFKEGNDWFIEIPDLQALSVFAAANEIMFNGTQIEIYDAYRE